MSAPTDNHENRDSPVFGRLTSSESLILGVANNVARGLGVDVGLVRVNVVVLGLAAGWGIGIYLVLFLLLYGRELEPREPALRYNLGVVAATAAQIALVGGTASSAPPALLWPALLIASALILSSHLSAPVNLSPSGSGVGRVLAGVLLMIAGLVSVLAGTEDLSSLWRTGAAVVVVVAGLAVVLAPWYQGVVAESETNRRANIRAEERADVAAHLHDSVLQTLTLIQNRAGEPEIAAALAHQQERELRRWLYHEVEGGPDASASFRQSLENEAARVEDHYLKIIECIVVGDRAMTDDLVTVVSAATEAMVNAAKFAEIPMISVFAEVTTTSVLVFVRDRGVGFDMALVPNDRHGLTDSIRGRIERLGGTVDIKTEEGRGTEIKIECVL